VSNGPAEAVNYSVTRVKRVAFGFRRVDHYRIRALLYGGRSNGPSSTPSPQAGRRGSCVIVSIYDRGRIFSASASRIVRAWTYLSR